MCKEVGWMKACYDEGLCACLSVAEGYVEAGFRPKVVSEQMYSCLGAMAGFRPVKTSECAHVLAPRVLVSQLASDLLLQASNCARS